MLCFSVSQQILTRLQYVQNSAAHVLIYIKQISLTLHKLHWHPISYIIQYKLLLTTSTAPPITTNTLWLTQSSQNYGISLFQNLHNTLFFSISAVPFLPSLDCLPLCIPHFCNCDVAVCLLYVLVVWFMLSFMFYLHIKLIVRSAS